MNKSNTAVKEILLELSDGELLEKLSDLSAKENEATMELLIHLGEVDLRKLYLPEGYSSLFSYCTQRLRYSEPAAMRRITCARTVRKYPALLTELQSRALSLTTLSMVAKVLTPENYLEVVGAVRGASKQKVEDYLARHQPRMTPPRERIKAVVIARPKEELSLGSLFENSGNIFAKSSIKSTDPREGNSELAGTELSLGVAKEGGMTARDTQAVQPPLMADGLGANGNEATALHSKAPETTTQLERRYEVKFTISTASRAKLDEAKLLLSGKHPRGATIEDVFEEAIEYLLERRSPKRRMARRVARQEKLQKGREALATEPKTEAKGNSCAPVSALDKRGKREIEVTAKCPIKSGQLSALYSKGCSRHIPLVVRDEVYLRDQGRCSYVSPSGVRCSERVDLEIHHTTPFGLGGTHTSTNLTCRCRSHNLLEAELVYGHAFMAGKIRAQVRGREPVELES